MVSKSSIQALASSPVQNSPGEVEGAAEIRGGDCDVGLEGETPDETRGGECDVGSEGQMPDEDEGSDSRGGVTKVSATSSPAVASPIVSSLASGSGPDSARELHVSAARGLSVLLSIDRYKRRSEHTKGTPKELPERLRPAVESLRPEKLSIRLPQKVATCVETFEMLSVSQLTILGHTKTYEVAVTLPPSSGVGPPQTTLKNQPDVSLTSSKRTFKRVLRAEMALRPCHQY